MSVLIAAAAVPCGLLIGVLLGALGGGGSVLAVPALVYLLGQSPHEATAGALIVVTVGAVTGMACHARAGRVRWAAGAAFGALGTAGSYLGSRWSAALDPAVLMAQGARRGLCPYGTRRSRCLHGRYATPRSPRPYATPRSPRPYGTPRSPCPYEISRSPCPYRTPLSPHPSGTPRIRPLPLAAPAPPVTRSPAPRIPCALPVPPTPPVPPGSP